MWKIVVPLLVLLCVAACGRVQGGLGAIGIGQGSANRSITEINGITYRARTKADGEEKRLINVTVTPVSSNPDAAKEAGRNAATRYCLLTFGGSDTDWIKGPNDAVSELLDEDGTSLELQGRCTQR